RADREQLYTLFDAVAGCMCFRSDANFVLVRIPSKQAQPLTEYLKSHGIVVKMFSEDEFRDCVRITLGTQDQNQKLFRAIRSFFFSPS
ncbi:MAG: aminotransferase class I/II-fold pyridoxal phosphate-dependent enzyme, partial [Ignavibacteriales bacterium]|nr:aminotransferase class I/II-fold pyridoxal phosphate-dependent enzyme [Ignavibacteriales bacterium]